MESKGPDNTLRMRIRNVVLNLNTILKCIFRQARLSRYRNPHQPISDWMIPTIYWKSPILILGMSGYVT